MTCSRMITDRVVGKIKRNLAAGISMRRIADKLGVSSYTVWQVSKGVYNHEKPLVKPKRKLKGIFDENSRENWIL